MRDSHLSLRAVAWFCLSVFVWLVVWRELHNLWNTPSINTAIALSSTATGITFYTLSILKDEPLIFLWIERVKGSTKRWWHRIKDWRERKRIAKILTAQSGTYLNELRTVHNPLRNEKRNREK